MIIIVYVTKSFGFRRGEIYFADLDPHYGSEQGGKRPVIVIQNNTGNKFSPTVIVAAVTSKISKKPNQPTHVLIDKNPAFNRPSVVLLEQLFTIDKERIWTPSVCEHFAPPAHRRRSYIKPCYLFL